MPSYSAPEPLASRHDLGPFRCGKDPLDDFLKSHALGRQNAKLSRTYVVTLGDLAVVAYYTLAHVAIVREEAPKKIGRGMPAAIPAILLARLAIDERHQGRGLGRSLFVDAVARTWAVMKDGPAPVRFFVVDAMDEEAKAFYQRFDMIPSPANPMRLFLHYKSLRALFGEG
jgi:GNAT superfamily N-acetyltransferase